MAPRAASGSSLRCFPMCSSPWWTTPGRRRTPGVSPSEYMVAASQAELSVSLLVQLRNRALDAYSEIMRMSI